MVLTDRIMGGVYPNFVVALQQIALTEGNSLTHSLTHYYLLTYSFTQVSKDFTRVGYLLLYKKSLHMH